MGPTISVVLPNYNHAQYLRQAIEEIVNQTRPPDEFLILDDASTDDSVEIIKSYAQKHPVIRLMQHRENRGVHETVNRLIEEARGDYIYAGAADDSRFPRFLELAMEMAEKHPGAGVICGKMQAIDEDGEPLAEYGIHRWKKALYAPPRQVLRDYFDAQEPSHSLCGATVFRKDALLEIGGLQTELKAWGDTLSARAIALQHGMCYIPVTFCAWRVLDDSYSATTRSDPRIVLELINDAVAAMRSKKFRDRFPSRHVRRWARRYRWHVVRSEWLGRGRLIRPLSRKFWIQAVRGLPRLVRGVRLVARETQTKA